MSTSLAQHLRPVIGVAKMVCFLDFPAEIRQNVLSYLLPDEIRALGPSSRESAMESITRSCRTLRSDVLQLYASWSPTFRFDAPGAVTGVNRSAEAYEIRTISLRLFAVTELKDITHGHGAWYGTDEALPEWIECINDLPHARVSTVVVDLTPVPMWMYVQRPDWVRSTILDDRCRMFLRAQERDVVELMGKLFSKYGEGVSVQIGGQMKGNLRRLVQDIIDKTEAAHSRRVEFTGEWVSGERDNPVYLSLPHISCRWGMATEEPYTIRWSQDMRFAYKSHRGDRPARPDLALEKLGPVTWSKWSITSYYINARDNESEARETLVRLLAFALETKQGCSAIVLELPPATKERRKLAVNLAKDLGMKSEIIGDEGEKFVRISAMPAELPQHDRPADEFVAVSFDSGFSSSNQAVTDIHGCSLDKGIGCQSQGPDVASLASMDTHSGSISHQTKMKRQIRQSISLNWKRWLCKGRDMVRRSLRGWK